MQDMLAAFISMNMSGIPPTKGNPIGRTFPSIFMINLPEEEQIVEDLDNIEGMQVILQAISFFICAIVAISSYIRYVIDADTHAQSSNIAFHSFLCPNCSEVHVGQTYL